MEAPWAIDVNLRQHFTGWRFVWIMTHIAREGSALVKVILQGGNFEVYGVQ